MLMFLALFFACSTETPPEESLQLESKSDRLMKEIGEAKEVETATRDRVDKRQEIPSSNLLEQLLAVTEDSKSGVVADGEEGNSDSTGTVSGLTGAKEVQIGTGGLGSRGIGIGGGGMASGLSGYGRGGVALGGGIATGPGSFGSGSPAPDALPREVDHGVNAFVATADDALSTFAADVDTASYATSRRFLRQGRMPPIASIRTEEFINAQRYPLMSPDAGEVFAASLEAAPHPYQAGHHLMRVSLQTARPTGARPPVQLTFLVDTSGSMSGSGRLELAKRSLIELVHNLRGDDEVAIATYAGDTRLVLPATAVEDKDTILAAIAALTSGGGTATASGMATAYAQASAMKRPGSESRVVLLSDGDANIGPMTPEGILSVVSEHAQQGISLTTVGFGQGNYRGHLMEQLANKGDGNHFYVDSLAEAKRVFGRDISGTLVTVARDVKLQVEFDPTSVRSYRLIGYENRAVADVDFRNDSVDAGEVGQGHAVTALYDLVLTDQPTTDLATLRIRYKAPGPDTPATEERLSLPSAAIAPDLRQTSPGFQLAMATASFAELLRESPHRGSVTWTDVSDLLRGLPDPSEDVEELAELVDIAHRLRPQRPSTL